MQAAIADKRIGLAKVMVVVLLVLVTAIPWTLDIMINTTLAPPPTQDAWQEFHYDYHLLFDAIPLLGMAILGFLWKRGIVEAAVGAFAASVGNVIVYAIDLELGVQGGWTGYGWPLTRVLGYLALTPAKLVAAFVVGVWLGRLLRRTGKLHHPETRDAH